jgi:hypothetical protein
MVEQKDTFYEVAPVFPTKWPPLENNWPFRPFPIKGTMKAL